jgi:hypothetical protein
MYHHEKQEPWPIAMLTRLLRERCMSVKNLPLADDLRIGITLTRIPLSLSLIATLTPNALADTPPPPPPQTPAEQLNLDPQIIEDSPVLQRWLEGIPDVRSDIRHDPSFRTRLRLGYTNLPSTQNASGMAIGIEDLFIGQTGLTLSADYQTAFDRNRESYGTNLRYYILPLGNRINIAPLIGYRSVAAEHDSTDGIDVGMRLLLIPSRTAAADIAFTQTWIIPTDTDATVSLSTLSFAYALTQHLRLATDLQLQHTSEATDNRVGIGVEWMF